MPDEAAAVRKFESLANEARQWKGPPLRADQHGRRRLTAWSDLEIRQAGRGLVVQVKTPRFNRWWNEPSAWAGDPVGEIFEWLAEEETSVRGSEA